MDCSQAFSSLDHFNILRHAIVKLNHPEHRPDHLTLFKVHILRYHFNILSTGVAQNCGHVAFHRHLDFVFYDVEDVHQHFASDVNVYSEIGFILADVDVQPGGGLGMWLGLHGRVYGPADRSLYGVLFAVFNGDFFAESYGGFKDVVRNSQFEAEVVPFGEAISDGCSAGGYGLSLGSHGVLLYFVRSIGERRNHQSLGLTAFFVFLCLEFFIARPESNFVPHNVKSHRFNAKLVSRCRFLEGVIGPGFHDVVYVG